MIDASCMVVMYHYVRDTAATGFPNIRALAPDLFAQQLDWLQERYTIIDTPDLEGALAGTRTLPPQAAFLTFDDGFVDHWSTVFPLLRARGLRGACFLAQAACGIAPRLLEVHKAHFLLAHLGAEAFGRAVVAESQAAGTVPSRRPSAFGNDRWDGSDERAIKHLLNYELPFADASSLLEALFVRHLGSSEAFARRLYLDEPMIREMAGCGITFGYHTRTHRMLARLSADEQRRELEDGVEWIRGLTGQTTVPFCYPWGGTKTYTHETIRTLEEAGYSLAFNTVRRRLTIGSDSRYELPRFDTRDLPPYTRGEEDAVAAAMSDEG